jgi:hypothetical protein
MTALFPWQGDRPQALVGARSPSKAKIRLPILSPWPSSTVFQAKAKAKKKTSSLHGFLNRWKTLCLIPGKAKVVLNKRRRRYASFRASVYVMDGRP